MSRTRIHYLDAPTLTGLKESIVQNIPRYRINGFSDLASNRGWSITLDVEIDTSYFHQFDLSNKSSETDGRNSMLTWKALHNLTPALAVEERIWTRLSHVECFEYSKSRWLKLEGGDDELASDVSKHFFAQTLTGYRDDHSISRLWWNAWVAKTLRPEDFESALKLICMKADIRQALVERSASFSRVPIGRGILRLMERSPSSYIDERSFRSLMKVVNLQGGGIVFEKLSECAIDEFMDRCLETAQKNSENT